MFEHLLTSQVHLLRAHFVDATALRDCDHTDCLKIGVHSMSLRSPGVNPLVRQFYWHTGTSTGA
jgi:hypothetical protein